MVGGTGCSSVGKVLMDRFNGTYLPEENLYKNGKMILQRKHTSIQDLLKHKLISRKKLSSYLAFATIRNPFDSIASHFARLEGATWENFLKQPDNWVYQSGDAYAKMLRRDIHLAREQGFDAWLFKTLGVKSRIKGWIKLILKKGYPPHWAPRVLKKGVAVVMRYEHLEKDFNSLLRQAGIEEWVVIPNINPTQAKRPYQGYYSPRSQALIEKLFANELAEYGYTFA